MYFVILSEISFQRTPLMKHTYLALALLAGLSSCASSGRDFDAAQVDRLIVNQSTDRDVVALLGSPNGLTGNANGYHSMSYLFTSYRTNPAMFVPIVGLAFAGDSRMTVKSALFTFSADGVLRDVSRSGTNVGSGFYQ
jgi:hypothetical protein